MGFREIIILGEMFQEDNDFGESSHLSIYAFEDDPDHVIICLTNAFSLTKDNFDEF